MTQEELTNKVQEHYPDLMAELQEFYAVSGTQDAAYLSANKDMFYITRNGDSYRLKREVL